MSKLYLDMKNFAVLSQQALYVMDDGEQRAELFLLKDLPGYIFQHKNLDEVVFRGNKNFIQNYVREAKNYEITHYDNANIKYTVIEGE